MDERLLGPGERPLSPIDWTTVWFGSADHFDIMRDANFIDNALYLLLEHPW